MRLTSEERRILLDALRRGPRPDGYDFGPAYEADKDRWGRLYRKVEAEPVLSNTEEQR
jgi:hypothetical protein